VTTTAEPTTELQEFELAGSVGQLAAALAAVQEQLPHVAKDQEADAGTYRYSYADLAAVSTAVLPLLGANGLAFTSFPTMVDGKFVLRYHLLHKSGESLDGVYPLGGGNAQAVGSSITYARRYTLCAVTGVAPDDDDDAAAAVAGQDAARDAARALAAEQEAQEQAQAARELNHAKDAVRGAWAVHYGDFDKDQAGDLFRTWSKGGTLTTATAGQLRAFAAYLSNLPVADAGSEPTTPPPSSDPEARPEKLSKRDNAHMFVLFEKLGYKDDRQGQLDYLSRTLGRKIGSRSEVMQADAPAVLAALKADVEIAERTGEQPMTSDPAAGAQSASGESRVPAGSDTASGGV
jgi:hypothetical protein